MMNLRAPLAVAVVVLAASTAAAQTGPLIPFETDRAQARGDRNQLRLLDDASRIPANRIHHLPVVEGRLGEYASLDGGLLVYFPYGRIERAEVKFAKYQLDISGSRVDPDPNFRKVSAFDKTLGPVCAARDTSNGGRIEMRLSDKAISLVETRADQSHPSYPADNMSYRVVTAASLRWLDKEPEAASLHRTCGSTPVTAKAPAAPAPAPAPKKTN